MVIFWLFLWVCFSFTPSYILWITPQDLAKWDTLLRYISVLSFINIAHVVVKLKSFKVSCVLILHPWNGPIFPLILFDLAEILTRDRPIIQTHCLIEKFFKILKIGWNGTYLQFMVLVQFWVQFTTGSFHDRWCNPGHDPSQTLIKIWLVVTIYKT